VVTTRQGYDRPTVGNGRELPRMARLRGAATPGSHAQASDACPDRRLRDRRPPARLAEKGV